MSVLIPTSLADAVAAMASRPGAALLAGGTDLMVGVNEGHRSLPEPADGPSVISLTRVPELTSWSVDPVARQFVLGAGVRWREIERDPIASFVPALAEAGRTVGSPQIRNAGTVGGNVATCSPAGDGLPVLSALDAVVNLASPTGRRTLPIGRFMLGVKRTAIEPSELIESITMPMLEGWQGYSKVGVRNAMVIATASACVATDTSSRSVRIALGSVAPTIVRCPAAEALAIDAVDWDGLSITADAARSVGLLAAEASSPIDDHRSTAAYRRHAVGVMVERLLLRAFTGSRR